MSSDPVTSTISSSVPQARAAVVLVLFIGGMTFAELAAMRFLSKIEGLLSCPVKF